VQRPYKDAVGLDGRILEFLGALSGRGDPTSSHRRAVAVGDRRDIGAYSIGSIHVGR